MMAESQTESLVIPNAPAQDDTTEQLTRIWQDLLGIPSITPDQNYFDLGGDSPLAVQLFARIEKTFHVKLPLATLFEAPTIEGLAQILRREAPSSAWSSLVPIQPHGARPPFFCFHGAGGNILIYRDLSLRLGSDQPVYGLQSPGLDGSCPALTRIEDMAALYVKEIRRVQRHGPYFLGGYCLGGTIAFEVGRQLRAHGEEVALLALFDTMNWHKIPLPSFWMKSYTAVERLLFHAANIVRLDPAGRAKFFSEKVKILRSRLPVWRGMLVGKFKKNSTATRSNARILSQIWQANDHASMAYTPELFAGTVTDFRPLKQYRMFSKPGVKWDRLAQGTKVVVLPVYPAGMLVEPFVKHLGDALRTAIDEALASKQASAGPARALTHAV